MYARVPIADENYQSIVSGVLMEIKKIDRRSPELLRHGYTHRVDLDDFDLEALEHMLVSGSGGTRVPYVVYATCSRLSRFVYDTRRCFWECNRRRSRSRSYMYSVYFRSDEDVMIFMLSLNQG